MNYRPQIAAEVRAEMAAQKYTVTRLASQLGISRSTLTNRLMGHSAFDTDELTVVASTLGVSAGDLIARAETRAAA